MRRIALKVEYDGTDFRGWQLQPNGRTVQEVLERAIQKATGTHSRIHGSGRTDAGAHAEAQVAHFDTETNIPTEQIRGALNHYLPRDTAVLAACDVGDDFHSRFHAQSKLYRYRVLRSPVRRPLRRKTCLRESRHLELPPMVECARMLRGEHDFASFGMETHLRSSTVRTMTRSEWEEHDDELHYLVEANGFLYRMVRILVGTMLHVGLGKMDVEEFRRVLEARDRRLAGPTKSAHALTLVEVHYPPGMLGWD